MTNNKIKAIFFDLDGTLRHSVPVSTDVFNEYVVTLGMQINEEDRIRSMRWEHFYWASSADLREDLVAHSPDTENFWTEYTRRRLIATGASTQWAIEHAPQVSAHMGEMYRPKSIVPPDVQRTLPILKEAGYFMAVISNRDKPFNELLQKYGISDYFSYSLAAGEVNSYKPDPGVFIHALEQTGMSAQETVYVGDNYFADVVGALRAGLKPVLYDPNMIFPGANCATIKSFDELQSVIEVI